MTTVAPQVEGVLADTLVARAGALDLLDAGEGVFDADAFAEAGAARGLPLRRGQGLQQGFLRVQRNGPATGRGTGVALCAGLADRRPEMHRRGTGRDRDDLAGRTGDATGSASGPCAATVGASGASVTCSGSFAGRTSASTIRS